MKREIFWEAHSDSTSFPSGGRKIYHECSAIGDMLSAIQNLVIKGLDSKGSSLYSFIGGSAMLSVSDLININYIPDEDDISLQLLIDFYEEYLCKRIFIFTLKNGKVIKLFFRDATEIFHISGINHIYEGVPMDGKRFLQGVKNKTIDLKTVEKVNAAAYKDYVIRIRSMACIDAIIKKCEYLWFPDAKIPDSKIEVRYLLLKGLDEKNLHLGIDAYNEKKPYYSKTLLVTEGNNADKFIGKADERLRVAKLEIRDKNTDDLLICINRELAEEKALEEIRKHVNEWFSDDFKMLVSEYLLKTVNQKLFEKWIQHLNSEHPNKIKTMDSDVETVFEMQEDLNSKAEWKVLFFEILEEKMSDEKFLNRVVSVTMHECDGYERILHSGITRVTRDEWKVSLKKVIAEKRADIRCEIEKYDGYTSGKILGEVIRKYEKEELNVQLSQKIEEFISQKGKDIVCDILKEEISQQKEVVLRVVDKILKEE